MPFDVAVAKQRLVEKDRVRRAMLHERFTEACRDCNAIVAALAARYAPVRIYQWGSLLREELFWEYSDIDIGVEGIRSAAEHAAMQADAEAMTAFPVDLVNMEKIDPLHRETIRTQGKLVYGRK